MRLVLAGEGPLASEVQSLLQQAGVQELAWLAGERADIPALLRGLSCFVLPSLAEGISNTILEAMACGLPIVATRVGGNAELIEDRLTGSLVPAADVDAAAGAIVAYFNDPATARQHGKAGRQRVEERYSLECMVDNYHRLYSRLLRRKTAGASSAHAEAPGERANS